MRSVSRLGRSRSLCPSVCIVRAPCPPAHRAVAVAVRTMVMQRGGQQSGQRPRLGTEAAPCLRHAPVPEQYGVDPPLGTQDQLVDRACRFLTRGFGSQDERDAVCCGEIGEFSDSTPQPLTPQH